MESMDCNLYAVHVMNNFTVIVMFKIYEAGSITAGCLRIQYTN